MPIFAFAIRDSIELHQLSGEQRSRDGALHAFCEGRLEATDCCKLRDQTACGCVNLHTFANVISNRFSRDVEIIYA